MILAELIPEGGHIHESLPKSWALGHRVWIAPAFVFTASWNAGAYLGPLNGWGKDFHN